MKRTRREDRPKVLTTDEIAARLRVSKRQAQQLCDEGTFPHAYRTSKGTRAHWRVPVADLDDFEKRRGQSQHD